MKTNSTFVRIVLFTIVIFSSLFTIVHAQCVAPGMKFANPVLISGAANQVDAVYKFPSVITGVDALVKITGSVNGATLTSIDDNTFGYSDAWQPVVKTPLTQGAIESYMSFKMDFVKSTDGTTHTFICFTLSAIDVDGDAANVREMVAANNFTSYAVSNATSLTLTNQAGMLKAVSTIINFPGIDTTSYVSNINYRYLNKSTINEIQVGSVTNPSFTVQDRYSCIYFRPIYIQNMVVLPVQYLSLNAARTGTDIQLQWQTNEKTGSHSFSIERSFDGSNFSPINAVVAASGKENLFIYQAADMAPDGTAAAYLYYRIKQADAAGKITYSNLSYVHIEKATVVEAMTTAPNPFTEKITLQFTSANNGNVVISIANTAGVTVLQKKYTTNKGRSMVAVNGLTTLHPGVYTVHVTLNGELIASKKIIK